MILRPLLASALPVAATGASGHARRQVGTPASVMIVTAADIRSLGYRTLGDLLRKFETFGRSAG